MRVGTLLSMAAFVVAGVVGIASCDGRDPATAGDVDLAGIDTSDLIPREKHEWSRHVSELIAPCPDVAVSIAVCVRERRACDKCVPAAIFLKQAVREGLSAEQVERLYKSRFDPSLLHQIPLDGSPSKGAENARVTVVEFADFECAHCAAAAPTIAAIFHNHEKEARFVFKYLPLPIHPHGEIAARAAIAAQAQGRFWEMHDVLFANGAHLERADLDNYARGLQLDMDRFQADFDSPATTERLRQDRALADTLKVRGTPSLFVNGRQYDGRGGTLDEWIVSELTK